MQFLQQLTNRNKSKTLLLIFLSVITGASMILQAYSIVTIVNDVFIKHSAFHETFPSFGYLLLAIIVRLLAQFQIGKIGGAFAASVKISVRQKLLAKWTESSLEQHVQHKTGERVTLLVDTVEQLESYYREYIPQVIKTIIVPLMILATVFYIHPNSGWIMLITAPFVPITYIIIGMQTKKKSEEQLEALNQFSGKFLDLLQGLQTIRLFGQSKKQEKVLATSNEGFLERTLSVLKIAFASTLFIELIATLGIGLVALEIGFQMIVFQTLTFAPAFFVLTLAPEYYNSLKELGSAFHTGRGSLGAANLIEQQLNEKTAPVQWGNKSLPRQPEIALKQAVYRYANGTTIGPISCTIPQGKTIAFIGQTGHGKSTILNMLSSLIEIDQGTITFNNEPRACFNEADWYQQTSYISQHPYIFAGTLRDNIRMGLPLSDEEILSALQEAQLMDWYSRIPQGLDISLGEGGLGLSGGEKQRVAIARAFLKKPNIVFFDEPTAGLDVLTEQLLSHSIQALSQFATVIIAAHQFESIRFADVIYLVENGQIAAYGTHNELIQHPFYQRMMKGGIVDESISGVHLDG
jgi:ATP-binding cassette, subfamily C, bacterial CydD